MALLPLILIVTHMPMSGLLTSVLQDSASSTRSAMLALLSFPAHKGSQQGCRLFNYTETNQKVKGDIPLHKMLQHESMRITCRPHAFVSTAARRAESVGLAVWHSGHGSCRLKRESHGNRKSWKLKLRSGKTKNHEYYRRCRAATPKSGPQD